MKGRLEGSDKGKTKTDDAGLADQRWIWRLVEED